MLLLLMAAVISTAAMIIRDTSPQSGNEGRGPISLKQKRIIRTMSPKKEINPNLRAMRLDDLVFVS